VATIFFLILLVATVVYLRKRGTRCPDVVRDGMSACIRQLRIAIGSYRLADVADCVVAQALAAAIPSVSCTYMPTSIDVALSEEDGTAWAALIPMLADELAELIATAATRAGFRLNGPVSVTVRVDAAVDPGKPRVTAVLAPAGEAADGVACAARTHRPASLEKTQVISQRLRRTQV
jgi:hypothetical protein